VGVLADLTKLHVFAAKDGVRINMDAHATQQMEPAE
jgi:hypothetical protein